MWYLALNPSIQAEESTRWTTYPSKQTKVKWKKFSRKENKEQKVEETGQEEKNLKEKKPYESEHEVCFLNFLKV